MERQRDKGEAQVARCDACGDELPDGGWGSAARRFCRGCYLDRAEKAAYPDEEDSRTFYP